MIITEKWLQEKSACSEGAEWFVNQKETDGLAVVKKLIAENKLDWANWLIVRVMEADKKNGYRMYVSYAVYAAECVIDIFEKKSQVGCRKFTKSTFDQILLTLDFLRIQLE